MERKVSLSRNLIMNILRTTMSVIFPLITFPYISRVLTVDGIGSYNYASSIVSYFTLLAGLGINAYAVREGAKLRDKKELIEDFAGSVLTLNLISTLFSYVSLILLSFFAAALADYRCLILILSVSILFNTIGVEWIYTIYEDFFYITLRSFIFNLLGLLLMILLVKKPTDIYIYTIIHVLSTVGSNIFNIILAKKYVKIKLNCHCIRHLKPILILFSMSVAIQIYVNVDVTMLGAYVGDYAVGLYNVSNKIYALAKMLIVAGVNVFIPRMSAVWGAADKRKFSYFSHNLLKGVVAFSFPLAIGLVSLSPEIVRLLAGGKYAESVFALRILCIAIPACCFSTTIHACILITGGKEFQVFISTAISAVSNFVLNLYFIPRFQQNGAAFTTLIAEVLVIVVDACFLSKNVDFPWNKDLLKTIASSLLGCVAIYAISILLRGTIRNYILYIIIDVIVSITMYTILMFVLKNDFVVFIKNYFHLTMKRKK